MVQVFHTSILPGSRLYVEGAKDGIIWDKRPPYPVLSFKGFSPSDLDLCYKALELAESFTRSALGQSMIVFLDLRDPKCRGSWS